MNIKQREDESIRSYVTRFNKEALLIDEADGKVLVTTFTNGLQSRDFLFFVYKKDPKTMADMLYRVTKYMNVEDTMIAWGADHRSEKGKMTPIKIEEERLPEWMNEGTIKGRNIRLVGQPISPR